MSIHALYQEIDGYIPAEEQIHAPRIGISSNRKEGLSCIAEPYVRAVLKAGGAPVLIPVQTDIQALTAIVEQLDGLLLSGGSDLNPLLVGEEPIPQLQEVDEIRDLYELTLLRLASNRQLPVMGICRGHQLLNVAFGGSIYQDMQAGMADSRLLKHSQKMPREQASHHVELTGKGRILPHIFPGVEQLAVNSFHHQAVREIAPEFIGTAIAPDGINEAIEHQEKELFSVQWHPEAMINNEQMFRLFRHHVEAARRFAQAKALHARIVTLDSHTDAPMLFPGPFDIGKKEGGKVNLPFMEEGRIDAAFMVAYIPQGKRDEASLQAATAYAEERILEVRRQELLHPERMGIATSRADILRLKSEGRKSILLGVENGYAIGKDLENIRKFRDLGVLYITLCHNGDNDICDSARGTGEWNGLSLFGKEVVRKMNDVGIMIDLSHASEKSFYDALEISRTPIIASHSSARALCNHPRNLTDDQLRALAAYGGVAQVCLYKGFINADSEQASLTDAIRHIDHMVEVAGIDHVGIGSDFDGDGELVGCRATNELINITVRLLAQGYTDEDIQKIWGGNLLRVLDGVQQAAYE